MHRGPDSHVQNGLWVEERSGGMRGEEKGENIQGNLYLLHNFAKTKLQFLELTTLSVFNKPDLDLHELFLSLV